MTQYISLSLSEVTSGTWGRSLGFSQPQSTNYGLKLLERKDDIFGAIHTGDVNQVLKFIAEDKGVLHKRDAKGAAPVHAAFLHGKEDIGKTLVQMHPECTLDKYEGDLYNGENILHIAIMHRQTPLAAWLLKQNPQLLNAEATGHFFEPSGDAYFGGFPFLFAVSSNQQDIAEHILQCDGPESLGLQNSVLLQDSHGNNALHMAVIHNLPDMYDFAMAHATAMWGPKKALEFGRTLNAQHLTPLALAAAMGRVEMFCHILDSNSTVAWEYGPIKCKNVPIWSLEQPSVHEDRKERQMKEVLALHCICADAHQPITNCLKLRNGQVSKEVEKARLELVQFPEVQQLLDLKWETFGKVRFYEKLILVMGVQVLWVAGMVLPDHWRLDYGNVFNHPVSNGFIITIEGIVLISALQRLFDEARGLMQKGKRYIFQTHGAAALEQSLGTLFSVFYITSWILRLCDCLDEEDILASAAGLVGWCYSFFFLLGFRSTGPFIIMIMEIIKYDMRRIIVMWFAVLVAYTTALYLVMDWQNQPGVTQYFQQMLNLVYVTVNANLFPQSNYIASAWMPILLTLTNMVLVLILLINLLIAMMSNTFNRVDNNAEWRWYIERANIMASFEASLTAREMEFCRRKYAVPLGGTADDEFADLYLQVKIVNPKWKLQSSKANDSPRSAASSNAVLQRTRPAQMAMPDAHPIRDPAYLGSPNASTPTSPATAAISDR